MSTGAQERTAHLEVLYAPPQLSHLSKSAFVEHCIGWLRVDAKLISQVNGASQEVYGLGTLLAQAIDCPQPCLLQVELQHDEMSAADIQAWLAKFCLLGGCRLACRAS